MKIVRKLNEPITEVTDIFCNKCGQSCVSPQGDFYGLIEQTVVGGFHSNHFIKDYDVHKFSLCDRCLSELVSSFIYPSYQGNLAFRDEENEHPDFDPMEFEIPGIVTMNNPNFQTLIDQIVLEAETENEEIEPAEDKKKEDMH